LTDAEEPVKMMVPLPLSTIAGMTCEQWHAETDVNPKLAQVEELRR
jgi:hypothetical protein